MILVCSKCSASFNVPESAIGEEGRLVRCSKCRNEWVAVREAPQSKVEDIAPAMQSAVEEAKQDAATADLPNDAPPMRARAPHRAQPKPKVMLTDRGWFRKLAYTFAISAALLCMVTIALTSHVQIVKLVPSLQVIYDEIGMSRHAHLAFGQVEIQQMDDGKMLDFLIPVYNTGEQLATLENLRLSILDDEGDKIASLTVQYDTVIPAKSKPLMIKERLNNIPASAKYIALETGNALEFRMHDIMDFTPILAAKINGDSGSDHVEKADESHH